MQHFCRLSNLKSLINSPSAPVEIKNLSEFLQSNHSRSNQSKKKPVLAEEEIYSQLLEYLKLEMPNVGWTHHNQYHFHPSNNKTVLSPWWFFHKYVHWKNKLFAIFSKHAGNSFISFYKHGLCQFGKIINIFTINDPNTNISSFFVLVNVFQIDNSFLTDWPLLNMYRVQSTNDSMIIKCEEIDCHCAYYEKNNLKILTKLYLPDFAI